MSQKKRPLTHDLRSRLRIAHLRAESALLGDRLPLYCPCCGTHLRRFISKGYGSRPGSFNPARYQTCPQEVNCPVCNSLPRHRILAVWCGEHRSELGGRILYFAQEDSMRRWFARSGIGTVSADISASQRADRRMDIQDTGEPDGSWDWIFCNHVLEHVPDYGKALREMHRILTPGGRLVCSFPIDRTYASVDEDPGAPREERLRRFGQSDHLRVFGRDSAELLSAAGFRVTRIEGTGMPEAILPVDGPADYDVNYLFLCEKI